MTIYGVWCTPTSGVMRYSLHRIQAGGRQNSSVSTTQQTPWDCTLCGKKTKLQNTGYGPPPQSVSVDASWTDTQRGNGFVVASLGHDATLQCSIALHRNNRIKLNWTDVYFTCWFTINGCLFVSRSHMHNSVITLVSWLNPSYDGLTAKLVCIMATYC